MLSCARTERKTRLHLLQTYVDLLPAYVLNWKLYGAVAICLALEASFFVRPRALMSVELLQDFVFGAAKLWLSVPLLLAWATLYESVLTNALPFARWRIAAEWPPAVQLVVGFLAADFVVYATHVLKHKISWVWQFHAVHHSQRNLNPLTTHRTHFVDQLFENPLRFLPLAFLGVGFPTWIGVRAVMWLWAHVIHSNVRWGLGPLHHVIVSPRYHRIHHSIEARHQDRNFGEHLVLWDWLFGTLYRDRGEYPDTGVADPAYPVERSARGLAPLVQLGEQYLYPFRVLLGRRVVALRARDVTSA